MTSYARGRGRGGGGSSYARPRGRGGGSRGRKVVGGGGGFLSGVGGFFGDVGGILSNAGGEIAAIGPGFYGLGRAAVLDVKNNPLSLLSGPLAPLTAQAWARGDTHLYRDVAKPMGKGYAYKYGPLFAHGDLGETLHRAGETPLSTLSDIALPLSLGTTAAVKAPFIPLSAAERSLVLRGSAKLAGQKLPKTAVGQTRKGRAQVTIPISGTELSRHLKILRHKALNRMAPEDRRFLGRFSEPDRAAKYMERQERRAYRRHEMLSIKQQRLFNKLSEKERPAAFYKNRLGTMENLVMTRDRMRRVNPAGPELRVLSDPEVLEKFQNPTPAMTSYLNAAREATRAFEEISGVIDLQRPWASILAGRGYSYMTPQTSKRVIQVRKDLKELENDLKAAEEQYSKLNFSRENQKKVEAAGGKVWEMEDADIALSQGHYPNGFPYPIRGREGEIIMPNGQTIYPKGYARVQRLRASVVTAKGKLETVEKQLATKRGIDVEQVRERFTPGYYKREVVEPLELPEGGIPRKGVMSPEEFNQWLLSEKPKPIYGPEPAPAKGGLVSADVEIARLKQEFAEAGVDEPFYTPDATVPEMKGTRGGGGRSPKTANYPTKPNRLLLQLMGYAASNIDLLTPEFLRKVAWAHAKDKNADLQALAVRKPKEYRLRADEEYVRGDVSEKISYMQKTRGEYERQRGLTPEELANDPEYQALVEKERYGLSGDEEIGLQGVREDLLTKDSSAAAIVGEGERLVIKTRIANRVVNEYVASSKRMDLIYNKPTLVWRFLVLNMRIGWLLNNIVGNGLLFVIANAGQEGLNALRRLEGLKGGISDEMTMKIAAEQTTTFMGANAPAALATASQSKILRGAVATLNGLAAPGRVLRAVDVAVEKKLRRRMLTNQLKKNPRFRRIYKDMPDQANRFDLAADRFAKFNPEQIDLISKEINDAMGNFFDMSNLERKALRGVFPFYAWYKAIVGVALRMPLDHPLRAAILIRIGDIGKEIQADDYGLSYLQGRITLPGGYALGTKAMNPFNTLTDLGLATSAAIKTPFGISPSRDAALALSGIYNPYLMIPGATTMGTLGIPASQYGFAGGVRGLPEVRLAYPRESDLYAGNKYLRELFGYLGAPVKKVRPSEARERGGE